MVGIVIQENENIDRAIRRFKKKYERSGILKEVKKRAYFTKPSVKKRMKKIKAIRRSQRTILEEMQKFPAAFFSHRADHTIGSCSLNPLHDADC